MKAQIMLFLEKLIGCKIISKSYFYEMKNNLVLNSKIITNQKDTIKKFSNIISSLGQNSGKETTDLLNFIIKNQIHSNSQLFQDLFILSQSNEKKYGYFVEFGAADGLIFSNTLLLEKKYKWTGIIAEPGIIWHEELLKNRNCIIDKRCVWNKNGEYLTFNQTAVPEFSTIDIFSQIDYNENLRNDFLSYNVETITLESLLSNANAPSVIDYLSIDTEGSEFEILSCFNFERYRFNFITVEHNFTFMREKIYTLLLSKGYKRVFEEVSFFDDWYVYNTDKLYNS